MADSVVDICNSALTKLGTKRITSLEDDTTAARACESQYDNARQDVLRSHLWNFAIKRVELAQVSGTTPAYEFDYYYQLPSDCLRVIANIDDKYGSDDSSTRWRVEANRRIATDMASMKIKYIANVTDVSQFDSLFAEALAYKLAGDICYQITQDRGLVQDMIQFYRQQLAHARFVDATEGTPEWDDHFTWVNARV